MPNTNQQPQTILGSDQQHAAVRACDYTSQAAVCARDDVSQAAVCELDNESPAAVCARDFTFTYAGACTPALEGICWEVPAGSFQLLVGDTGSGKTTLLRNCVPAIAPVGTRGGSLSLFAHEFANLSSVQAVQLVGYVAQNPDTQLVCDSVWHELAFGLENLGVPQDEMRVRVAEVAHYFGIEPWFRSSVESLSGGQKQLLALAAVLVMRPKLLLLDEPTSQLDPVAAKNFLHALFRVNRELGITVVVATHAPHLMAEYATSAVRLSAGQLCEVPLEQFAARALNILSAHVSTCSVPAPEESPFAITLRDAYLRYERGAQWVLRGLDLQVAHGEIHALLGGNGCGKTTILKLAAGVLSPERGSACNRLQGQQAYLPQNPKMLFVRDTVADELQEWQSACGYDDAAVSKLASGFGLAEHLAQHPYDLSGGQQQLLAFAKLLLTRPQLLLLDEPTKGLDPEAKFSLAQALCQAVEAGATVLMASHDLTFAALVATRVSLVFDGQVATTQPAHEFFAGSLFYRPVADGFSKRWEAR